MSSEPERVAKLREDNTMPAKGKKKASEIFKDEAALLSVFPKLKAGTMSKEQEEYTRSLILKLGDGCTSWEEFRRRLHKVSRAYKGSYEERGICHNYISSFSLDQMELVREEEKKARGELG